MIKNRQFRHLPVPAVFLCKIFAEMPEKILLKNKKGPQELFTAACYNVQMMEVSKFETNKSRTPQK